MACFWQTLNWFVVDKMAIKWLFLGGTACIAQVAYFYRSSSVDLSVSVFIGNERLLWKNSQLNQDVT